MKLWDRKRVDALKETALVRGTTAFGALPNAFVMLEPNAGPADGAQAAREILPGAKFSHLKNGYPIYTLTAE